MSGVVFDETDTAWIKYMRDPTGLWPKLCLHGNSHPRFCEVCARLRAEDDAREDAPQGTEALQPYKEAPDPRSGHWTGVEASQLRHLLAAATGRTPEEVTEPLSRLMHELRYRKSLSPDEEREALWDVERASYAMYSVICVGGMLTLDSPEVSAYSDAGLFLWRDELDGPRERL